MQLMLLGVQLDAGGADGQQALLVLAEVGDELVGVVRAFLLGVLEGADVVIAGFGGAVAAWVISVSAHIYIKTGKKTIRAGTCGVCSAAAPAQSRRSNSPTPCARSPPLCVS